MHRKDKCLSHILPVSAIANTEVFGPVFSIVQAGSLEDAIAAINSPSFGNMACILTSSGSAARQFRHEVRAGNIGVNLGVAAPMGFFRSLAGKTAFFGALHAQGRDAIDFFTEKKVVAERWPPNWSRKF